MAATADSLHHSGSLDVLLPSGKRKEVPWLVDAAPAHPGGPQLAVCLMHGASGGASSGHLPALAAAVVSAGLPCLRFTCRGGSVEHRAEVCKAVLAQAASLPGLAQVRQWVLAGHSMGARVACAVAEQQQQDDQRQESEQQRRQGGPGLPPIAAVVLCSYPLHPPGRPAELRDALLAQLQLPALLVRGTRDPFSQQALWDAALGRLGSPRWEQHVVQGGDHGLRCSAADGGSDAAMQGVAEAVRRFLLDIATAVGQQAGSGEQMRQRQQQLPPQRNAAAEGSVPAKPRKRQRGRPEQQAREELSKAAQQQQQPLRSTGGRRRKHASGSSQKQTAGGSDTPAYRKQRRA